MAETSRTSIISGPAVLEFDPGNAGVRSIYTQGDIMVKWMQPTFDVSTSQFGKQTSSRIADRMAQISFLPSGEWDSDITGVLFPYASIKPGVSIFNDKTLKITPLSGKPLSFPNCALTKMPPLMFAGTKVLMGGAEFTALGVDASTWATAGSLGAVAATGTLTDFTPFIESTILTQPYKHAWGAVAGFTALDADEDGIVWEPSISLKPFKLATRGTVDMRVISVDARIRGKIVGPTEEQVLTASGIQGTGAILGRSLLSTAYDFVVATHPAAATFFTAKNMALESFDFAYGENNRMADMVFKSIRKIDGTSHDLQPLFVIA